MNIFYLAIGFGIILLCPILLWKLYLSPKASFSATGRNKGRVLFLITIPFGFLISPKGSGVPGVLLVSFIIYIVLFLIIKLVEARR